MARAVLEQERSRATRKSIMVAAEEIWRTNGFDGVSVDDVCLAAGIAKGTFYFYFPRKEHLLVMLVFARMMPLQSEVHKLLESRLDTISVCSEFAAMIADRAQTLPKQLIGRGIEAAFRHYREVAKLPGGERNLRWHLHPVFVRGQERGEVRRSWDPETLGATMGWAILQGVLFWSNELVDDADFEDNLRQRAELIASGAGIERKKRAAPHRGRSKKK